MLKFMKKKQKPFSDQYNELYDSMNEHLELIRKNQDILNNMLDELSNMNSIILEHSEAISNVLFDVEILQELVNSKDEDEDEETL